MSTEQEKLSKKVGYWLLFIFCYSLYWGFSEKVMRFCLVKFYNITAEITWSRLFRSLFDGDLNVFVILLVFLFIGIYHLTRYVFKLAPNKKIPAVVISVLILIASLIDVLNYQHTDVIILYIIMQVTFLIPLISIIKAEIRKEKHNMMADEVFKNIRADYLEKSNNTLF